jgi:hypothetical protein
MWDDAMKAALKSWTLTLIPAAAAAVAAVAAGVGACGAAMECTFALDGASARGQPQQPAPASAPPSVEHDRAAAERSQRTVH